MRIRIGLLCVLLLMFPAVGMAGETGVRSLVINEVCSANDEAIKDADGESPDWVELYNPTGERLSLAGLHLTDKKSNPNAFTFGNTYIEPYGYVLVFASKKANMEPELHADFRLSSEGDEDVFLMDADGGLIDAVHIPELSDDVTYGRTYDGGGQFARLSATPRTSNNTARQLAEAPFVAAPAFSLESGFYDAPLELKISAPAGTTVYYTLNGDLPDESATPYTEPFSFSDASENPPVNALRTDFSLSSDYVPETVDQCHVVRAVAIDENGNQSAVVTKSYFVGFKEKTGYENVSVVSLVTSPDNLFSYDFGIYVTGKIYDDWCASPEYNEATANWWRPANYTQSGEEWERPAAFTYFDADGNCLYSQQIGIRMHGRVSRGSTQKSFNLYARKKYDGNGKFLLSPFENVAFTNSMMLRNGGNDGSSTKLRDVFFQTLMRGRAVETQQALPCALFINGEYWGLYNLQQRYDSDFFYEKYGVDKENVVAVDTEGVSRGVEADAALYQKFTDFVAKADLSTAANYKRLEKMVDMQSLIDYFCCEMFAGNSDWPFNNYGLWRARTVSDRAYEDGLWRFMLFDLDQTMEYSETSAVQTNAFDRALKSGLFAAVIKNDAFKQRFVLTMMDLLNERFNVKTTLPLLDDLTKRYSAQMTLHGQRFIYGRYSAATFKRNCTVLRTFLQNRPAAIEEQMAEYFDLMSSPCSLTVALENEAQGSLSLNTLSLSLTDGTWTGRYFPDYPVTILAQPADGFVFSHWEVENGNPLSTLTDPTISLRLSTLGTRVTAVFEAAQVKEIETLAEFSFASPDEIKGSVQKGYQATGGAMRENARLFASTDGENSRKIAWSEELYDGENTPAVSGSSGNRWAAGGYVQITVPATDYQALVFSCDLGASSKGARNYALSYSTDGFSYSSVPSSNVILSRANRLTHLSVSLPDETAGAEQLIVRLSITSEKTIRGRARLTGSDEGEISINHLSISGERIPVSMEEYERVRSLLQALTGLPEQEAKALKALLDQPLPSSLRQGDVDAQTKALLDEAQTLAALRTGEEALYAFLPQAVVEQARVFCLCEGLEKLVSSVTEDIDKNTEFSYLYRLNNDELTLVSKAAPTAGQARAYWKLDAPGLYIVLKKPLWTYQSVLTTSQEPMTVEWMQKNGLTSVPSALLWLTVEKTSPLDRLHVELDLSNALFYGNAYIYEEKDGALGACVQQVRLQDGILAVDGLTQGKYLLLSDPVENLTDNAALRQDVTARAAQAAADQRHIKQLLLLAGGGFVGFVALLSGLIAFLVKRRRRRREEEDDD